MPFDRPAIEELELLRVAHDAREHQVAVLRAQLVDTDARLDCARCDVAALSAAFVAEEKRAGRAEREALAQRERAERAEREADAQRGPAKRIATARQLARRFRVRTRD